MYRILVAVDESGQRQRLCRCLKTRFRGRCTVLAAGSGTEAMELLRHSRPQAAVLDIEMQGVSGLEVARRLRQQAGACAIVLLTDRADFFYAREALRLRAMDCVLKPCAEEELARQIEEALTLPEEAGAGKNDAGGPAGEEDHTSLRLGQVRQDIEAFIREHYSTELSMQDVARAMNYSDAYFCKLFKRCFQLNFSAYLNEYRIERARELLRTTRLNVRDVSTACGYSDPNYFSRIFKRITGMTPSEYRMF